MVYEIDRDRTVAICPLRLRGSRGEALCGEWCRLGIVALRLVSCDPDDDTSEDDGRRKTPAATDTAPVRAPTPGVVVDYGCGMTLNRVLVLTVEGGLAPR